MYVNENNITTIDIYSKNGDKVVMELLLAFKLENYKYNYVIYRELDKSKTYVARYKGDKKLDLDTNLSKEEIVLCNKVLKEVQKNGR